MNRHDARALLMFGPPDLAGTFTQPDAPGASAWERELHHALQRLIASGLVEARDRLRANAIRYVLTPRGERELGKLEQRQTAAVEALAGLEASEPLAPAPVVAVPAVVRHAVTGLGFDESAVDALTALAEDGELHVVTGRRAKPRDLRFLTALRKMVDQGLVQQISRGEGGVVLFGLTPAGRGRLEVVNPEAAARRASDDARKVALRKDHGEDMTRLKQARAGRAELL